MADNDEKILKALEALQAGQKDIRESMATKQDIRTVKEDIRTVELKVEAAHEFNKKAHTEIVDLLVASGETNYHVLKKELKELKKRIEHLETRQQN